MLLALVPRCYPAGVFRRLADPDGGLKGLVLTAAQRDQLAIAD
jgi:hypothetical protein